MFDSDFDRRFRQSQRRFDIMFRIIATMIAVVFVAIVAFWVFVGVLAVDAVSEIEQHGVKSVVEKIWCGQDNQGCTK